MSQEEGMWYPQLPEGYPEPRYEAHNQQRPQQPSHQQPNYWPGGGYPASPPSPPSWPSQPGYPGHSGYPSQPGYPGHSSHPGSPAYPNYPGGGNYPSSPGYPSQPSYPGHGHHPQHSQQQTPTMAPPSQVPSYPDTNLRAVDPGGIAGCLYRYTYIWTSRNKGFWYYPTFVGRTSIAGYRWDPRHYRWEYYGLDLKHVDSFRCT